MFQKATKYAAKGRVALVGPAGSGKSFTMLTLTKVLAAGGKIAGIDTEHGSLSKYADLYDFDVVEMASFSTRNFLKALGEAEKGGYAVFFCDSLSHFWQGKDGALEFVDQINARNKDKMTGWKDFRPQERAMVDAVLASPCHVICTMRTKTDYQEVEGENGKKRRMKVGLAPIQRDGMEYEFDLVGLMDDENTFLVDKTRCPAYAGKIMRKPDGKAFAPFADWLKGAPRSVALAPAPTPMQNPSPITAAMAEELLGKANAKGYPQAEMEAWLANKFNVTDAVRLTVEQFNQTMKSIEGWKEKNGKKLA